MNGNDYEGKARCFDPPGVEKAHERLVAVQLRIHALEGDQV